MVAVVTTSRLLFTIISLSSTQYLSPLLLLFSSPVHRLCTFMAISFLSFFSLLFSPISLDVSTNDYFFSLLLLILILGKHRQQTSGHTLMNTHTHF